MNAIILKKNLSLLLLLHSLLQQLLNILSL